MSKFGERLRLLREEKDMLSKDFAKVMNVEPATITNWEKGSRFPKEEILIKIADYFDCSTDYLLGRTDDRQSKVYSGKLDDKEITIEIDKNYPHNLSPEEVSKLIDNLKSVGFDVEKLINMSKEKGQK
ncbi:MAG: helix-turn-helix transcriptional regulator [Candidatus Onthovivens sp.]|nr:helix-turn-helix transcriptional regulator [Candidatus Onthovivens sp.]